MSDDARRARRILAFRDELDALTREGVAPLDPEARAAIDAHHDAILARLRAADVDTTTSAAQLSLAMRIATVVGTLALALAWGSFLHDLWDNIPMVPRLLLTGVPPLVLAALVPFALRKETSGYVANLVATVAVVAFAAHLVVMGDTFDLPPSRGFFLAVGGFALALAYPFGLVLPLLPGLVLGAAWLWSLFPSPSGRFDGAFDRWEPGLAIALVVLAAPRALVKPAGFAAMWRGAAALAITVMLLILSVTHEPSWLRAVMTREATRTVWQLVGAIGFPALIALAVRREWALPTRIFVGGLLLFLVIRLADWFWDVVPAWLFFLGMGAFAMGAFTLLKRWRRRVA